jgi:hypothetical protein
MFLIAVNTIIRLMHAFVNFISPLFASPSFTCSAVLWLAAGGARLSLLLPFHSRFG